MDEEPAALRRLVFGGRLLDPAAVAAATLAFAIFCALSGAVYLFNDVSDRDADRRHPLKRLGRSRPANWRRRRRCFRPACWRRRDWPRRADCAGVSRSSRRPTQLLLVLYSVVLKHIVIIDVLTIAGGFVLRAIAGAVAVRVPISAWLLVCTTLLALFLGLSKRRHELDAARRRGRDHRRILDEYSPYLLDQMIAVVTASTLIAYTFYATSAETAERLGTPRLGLTIPFVLYGIFRYLYLVHQKRGGGSPAAMLLTDRPLLACVGLWVATVVVLLYSPLGQWPCRSSRSRPNPTLRRHQAGRPAWPSSARVRKRSSRTTGA